MYKVTLLNKKQISYRFQVYVLHKTKKNYIENQEQTRNNLQQLLLLLKQ